MKARSASRPRSERTWGARASAAWAGWEKPRTQLVAGEWSQRTRQQGSGEAILRGFEAPKESLGVVGGRKERKRSVRGW